MTAVDVPSTGLHTPRLIWPSPAALALPAPLITFLLLSLTAAYLFPLVWTLSRIGDDGTITYGAQLVSEGALPGRDFVEVMGPGSFYWLGFFFKLFGLGWNVTRLLVLFTGVATAGLLYAIARQVCRPSVALLLWFFVVVVGLPLWPSASHHWDSNFFAFAALWSYLRLQRTGRLAWSFAAGILVAATFCVMQQKGLLLLLALLLVGLPSGLRSAKWKPTALFFGSFTAITIGVATAYWKAGALAGLYHANVIWPLSSYHGINAMPYGRMLVSLAIAPAYQTLGPDWARAGLLYAGLSLIPFLVIGILPLLVAGSTVACLLSENKRRIWLHGPLLTLTLAGAALWLSEIHRRDFFHLVYGSPVLLIVLFAGTQMFFNARVRKFLMLTLAAGLTAFGSSNLLTQMREHHLSATRRGNLQSVSDDAALHFLCTSVKRREFVFVYPYCPQYYYLADVRNPTRFSTLLYGYNTPEQFDEVIRNLEQKRVPYVLWDQEVYGDKLQAWFPAYRHPPEARLKLEHYIQANYAPIGIKSGFRLLKRRTPALP